MKKRVTRIAAALFAATLAVTGTGITNLTADAAESGIITIENKEASHTYSAYQLFKGDVSRDGRTLSQIAYGSGINATVVDGVKVVKGLGKALKDDDTLGEKFAELADDPDAESLALALQGITVSADSNTLIGNEAIALGNILDKYLTTTKTDSTYSEDDKKYTISGLTNGYYFVKDSYDDTEKTSESVSAYIMQIVDGQVVAISSKSSVPTVEKKVWNDTELTTPGWADAADYKIGDEIDYKLDGTLAANYADFDTYKYEFVDTLSEGLTMTDAQVKAVKVELVSNGTASDITLIEGKDSITFENNVLTVSIADLKTTATTAKYRDTIRVTYSAQLTDKAVIGKDKDGIGNPNTVKLVYSNDPNYRGDGTKTPTDTTPEDKVTVFTFKVDALKKQPDGTGTKALAGATFQILDGDEILGEGTSDANGKVVFTKNGKETTLKQGTYTVKEKDAPENFTKVAEFQITVDATYDYTDAADPKIKELKVTTADGTSADVTVADTTITVIDRPTSNLPITGDSGRMLYYAVGGCVAIAALLYLLREKKNA